MSPTTPTIVIQGLPSPGVPNTIRLPTALWFGQYRLANVSLIATTRRPSARSSAPGTAADEAHLHQVEMPGDTLSIVASIARTAGTGAGPRGEVPSWACCSEEAT
jgi:hypothetical protein